MTTILTQNFPVTASVPQPFFENVYVSERPRSQRRQKKHQKTAPKNCFNSIKKSLKFSLSSLGISVPISSVPSGCLM